MGGNVTVIMQHEHRVKALPNIKPLVGFARALPLNISLYRGLLKRGTDKLKVKNSKPVIIVANFLFLTTAIMLVFS